VRRFTSPPEGQVSHCHAGGLFFAFGVEHPYRNPLICLGPDLTPVEHLAFDFIDFFAEVVGDPVPPVWLFQPYFVD